jgi:hypothetical protein
VILPIALVVVAAILISSGFTNRSIAGVINGGPEPPPDPTDPNNTGGVGRGADTTTSLGGGSPKAIIDNEVLPLARARGINVTPESVAAANARHSPITASGNISDHNGPPDTRWAADMSNGMSPTPQMDALAKDIASKYGLHWTGSGLAEAVITIGGIKYKVQLLYRTLIGGNHYNHVHFGMHVV